MEKHHLFLCGSGPPFSVKLAKKFSDLLRNSTIAILYIERQGSDQYLPIYQKNIEKIGLTTVHFPLKMQYTPDELDQLKECGGIIIGGGVTGEYRERIVETEIGSIITSAFNKGVPVAGFSAGSLIVPEHCVISPYDNDDKKQLFIKGLGLLPGAVVSAHFLEWQEEFENLKQAVKKTGVPIGYGIAENSCIYIHDGKLEAVEGYLIIERGC